VLAAAHQCSKHDYPVLMAQKKHFLAQYWMLSLADMQNVSFFK